MQLIKKKNDLKSIIYNVGLDATSCLKVNHYLVYLFDEIVKYTTSLYKNLRFYAFTPFSLRIFFIN